MTFVRALSEEERRALRRGVRREVGRVSERMRAVLLSGRRFTVPDIARIFECDEATVREWIARFESDGVPGLHDLPRSARERVRRAVEDGPASVGYGGTAAGSGVWTVVTLKLYLFVSDQLKVSDATVRRLLIALDFRWRRPKLVLPTDPEVRHKMWTLCECLLAAPAHAVVLCLDECDVQLLPVLRAMWLHRGEQVG
ncbi:MAG: helix-turn-helix domain-containing protein [Gemmatimonadaceae bacterium]